MNVNFLSRLSLRSSVYTALIFSGISGFIFGVFDAWTWQQAVEGSQVIAGTVRYPHTTPFLIYQVKAWTLLHQLPAIFLNLGMSEKALSLILSGILGGLSYQALAVTTFAFCSRTGFSLGLPFFVSISLMYIFGTAYPVTLMGVMMTYGVVGLSWMTLALALHGTSAYRLGAWMLGLSIAVHPVLGIFGWAFFFIAFLIERKRFHEKFPQIFLFFGAGCLCTLASLGVYFWKIHELLPPNLEINREVMVAFFKDWDGHRRSVPLESEDVAINFVVMLVTTFWLFKIRDEKEQSFGSRFLLRMIQVASLMSWVGMLISWIPVEYLPLWLVGFMPGRVFSFVILVYGALVFGLAARYRNNLAAEVFLGTFMLLIVYFAQREDLSGIPRMYKTMLLSGIVLILLRALGMIHMREEKNKGRMILIFRTTVVLICFAGFMANAMHLYRKFPEWSKDLLDFRVHPVYREINKTKALLLTSSEFGTIQLLTRRPVLIDISALDGIAYVPEAAQSSYEMIKEIYGVDLMIPTVGEILHQDLWAERSLEEWQRLAAKYHFTDILVPAGWQLKLPFVAGDKSMSYYHVPPSDIPKTNV